MDLYTLTDNMILSKFGETIKRLRLERNVSQKKLALSAGVAISSVAALERGESVSLKPNYSSFCTGGKVSFGSPLFILIAKLPLYSVKKPKLWQQ